MSELSTPKRTRVETETCRSQHPLVRDGLSQQQRLLKTLLPSYVKVDERSMKDLVQFVRKLGTHIRYFEYNGATVVKDTTWEIFFEITDQKWDNFDLEGYLKKLQIEKQTQPHLALFFGFLYMFRVAQDDLNTITKRHLEFYYREVLGLRENPAVPDQAAVIFKLAKNVNEYLVKKGTQLKGGKDDTGVERIYEVVEEVLINKAQVTDLKAVFANIHNRLKDDIDQLNNDHRIYASAVVNSSDGEGGKIENKDKSWRTFGQPEFTESRGDLSADRSEPEIGFAFASPILFLAEGTRTIKLELTFPEVDGLTDKLQNNDFIVRLSGEEEWLTAEAEAATDTRATNTTISLTRKLREGQPAVVAYDEEVLLQPFKTQWPVIQVLLNTKNSDEPFVYKLLKEIKLNQVKISVDVVGVKDLILQNDHAVLDPSKPFLPFGNRPHVGSKFYIGSWEVFQKKLTFLEVFHHWNELPNNFSEYYTNYDINGNNIPKSIEFSGKTSSQVQRNDLPEGLPKYLIEHDLNRNTQQKPVESSKRTNSSFKIDIEHLNKKNWTNLTTTSLFTHSNGNSINGDSKLPASGTYKFDSLNDNYNRDAELGRFDRYDLNTQRGFIRLTLKGVDFGHSVFPNAYARQAIELAKESPAAWAQLPNPPYTPSLQELSLTYESSVCFNFDKKAASEEKSEQFFYIEPFGVKEVAKDSAAKLVPRYEDEGNLYIGIDKLVPSQTLSLLFQVAEGSANPNRTAQEVKWAVLANNEWVRFDKKIILSDTTNGLLTSGIIRLSVPEEATNDNTLLPSGHYWLRASVTEQSDAISKLIDIRAQAVLVKFKDSNNDPDHLRVALPAGSISKLVKSDSAIDKVEQPYASFGGEVKEKSSDYYTRVSERLRHKQRAITIWDYEHMILQKFPSVYKVKCINHTRFEGTLENYSEMAPGHATLVVVSNVQNKNAVDPLRPMTSLSMLEDIHTWIDGLNPMSTEIHVRNPLYEEVRTSFKVKFHTDDFGYYRKRLEQELREFLSPWSSDCAADITFGGKIHKSVILNFVEERSYVNYISCFKMFHIVPLGSENSPNKDIDEAVATTAVSILGSADEHEILQLDMDVEGCDCPDNEVLSTEQIASADECPCYQEITSLRDAPETENIDLT